MPYPPVTNHLPTAPEEHPLRGRRRFVGALALGATLAVVALMTGQWLLLPLIGAVFVAETLSVVIQVFYFKRTHGKRFFKMAPLHLHCL